MNAKNFCGGFNGQVRLKLLALASAFSCLLTIFPTPGWAQVVGAVAKSDLSKSADTKATVLHLRRLQKSIIAIGNSKARGTNTVALENERKGLLDQYLSEADGLNRGDTPLLPKADYDFYLKARDEAIERFDSRWGTNPVIDQTGRRLAMYKGWVYYKPDKAVAYSKLFPGECPQWYAPVAGDNLPKSNDFIYFFLSTGLEQERELWRGNIKGQLEEKICVVNDVIYTSPVISPDGLHFAYVVVPVFTVMGERYCVDCFSRPTLEQMNQGAPLVKETTLYETGEFQVTGIKWLNDHLIDAVLQDSDGKEKKVKIPVPP